MCTESSNDQKYEVYYSKEQSLHITAGILWYWQGTVPECLPPGITKHSLCSQQKYHNFYKQQVFLGKEQDRWLESGREKGQPVRLGGLYSEGLKLSTVWQCKALLNTSQ